MSPCRIIGLVSCRNRKLLFFFYIFLFKIAPLFSHSRIQFVTWLWNKNRHSLSTANWLKLVLFCGTFLRLALHNECCNEYIINAFVMLSLKMVHLVHLSQNREKLKKAFIRFNCTLLWLSSSPTNLKVTDHQNAVKHGLEIHLFAGLFQKKTTTLSGEVPSPGVSQVCWQQQTRSCYSWERWNE